MIKTPWLTYSKQRAGVGIITIFASKIAACAGMNKYESVDDIKSEIYAKFNKDSTFKTREDKVNELINDLPNETKTDITSILTTQYTNVDEVQHVLDCVKLKHSNIDQSIVDKVRSTLYTNQGIQAEETIRMNVENNDGVQIITDHRFKICDFPIARVHDTNNTVDIFVGGKHDGQLADGTIVELKNRQRCFLGIPLYEKVQIHAYMVIYGSRKSWLVESFRGVEKKHVIEFDDAFWKDVVSNIHDFVYDCITPNAKREWVSTPTPNARYYGTPLA